MAVLALVGVFLSLYLLLHRLGFYGQLMCGVGGDCDVVQASPWAVFLGWPVAGWGALWYGAVFLTALAGVQPRFAESAWLRRSLGALAVGGLAFTAYLTYLELFVIEAICRWCVGSAVLVVGIAFLALLPDRRGRRERTPSSGGGPEAL